MKWNEAFGVAIALFAALMVGRTIVMIGNDMVLCPEWKAPLVCKERSTLGHLLFDNVGTPPR